MPFTAFFRKRGSTQNCNASVNAAPGVALMPGCECVQVEDLARLSFKRNPLYVGIDDTQAEATREGLEQGYCIVPSAQRFLLLFTFLKKNASKKARQAPQQRLCSTRAHAGPRVEDPGPTLLSCCPRPAAPACAQLYTPK